MITAIIKSLFMPQLVVEYKNERTSADMSCEINLPIDTKNDLDMIIAINNGFVLANKYFAERDGNKKIGFKIANSGVIQRFDVEKSLFGALIVEPKEEALLKSTNRLSNFVKVCYTPLNGKGIKFSQSDNFVTKCEITDDGEKTQFVSKGRINENLIGLALAFNVNELQGSYNVGRIIGRTEIELSKQQATLDKYKNMLNKHTITTTWNDDIYHK